MEPQNPSLVTDPDPEEPIEATDYYDAMGTGWLSSDAEEVLPEDPNLVGLPVE